LIKNKIFEVKKTSPERRKKKKERRKKMKEGTRVSSNERQQKIWFTRYKS